jgi:uncharacterized protein YdeI (YjbR/CyaY-like superfamily)
LQDERVEFFETAAAFRAWLRRNHTKATELQVGYYKKHTGKPSMTWPESVAEALCYGWIDGIRRRLDDERYTIRFTPRRPGSSWSAINIRMVAELEAAGKMTRAGRAAFEARVGAGSAGDSPRTKPIGLDARRIREFRKHRAAWRFFESQPPGYRKTASWWVMSAKREETRDRRLAKLVRCSAGRERIPELARPQRKR